MKKNYEKIYKRLIKEIKKTRSNEINPNNWLNEDNSIMIEVEKRASQYAVNVLDIILEINDEISGKNAIWLL